jgi:hypothetical protein
MNLTYRAAVNMLALCEWSYRRGVLDSSQAGDAEYVRRIADREDGYSTFQTTSDGPYNADVKRELKVWIDKMIAVCREIYADALADYLRLERTDTIRRDVLAVVDYQYRLGLRHGLRLRDRRKGREFYDDLNRGNSHHHLLDRQKWTTSQYFDRIKNVINTIHTARLEAKLPSTLDRLSNKFLNLIVHEKLRKMKIGDDYRT